MTQVALYDNDGTRFADLTLPELPRVGDDIELALPGDPLAKIFEVEHVVHRMVYDSPDVQNEIDTPWHWEIWLRGTLFGISPLQQNCTCAQGITECPRHGGQPAERDICPQCEKAVLGYCAAGVYCTSDDCDYAA